MCRGGQLRLRLFWVKMISGNHFHPSPHVWLQRKISFSGNSFPVDQYLLLWPGINFTLLFSVQIISGKRERERERERRESPDRREREEEERAGAIVRRARGNKTAIVWRARSSDDRAPRRSRLRARSSIEERRDRPTSALVDCAASRMIAPISPPISSRATRSHILLRCTDLLLRSRLHRFDEFFCWVLLFLWMILELIHYLHVYSWGSVWKIGHVKHFL